MFYVIRYTEVENDDDKVEITCQIKYNFAKMLQAKINPNGFNASDGHLGQLHRV